MRSPERLGAAVNTRPECSSKAPLKIDPRVSSNAGLGALGVMCVMLLML